LRKALTTSISVAQQKTRRAVEYWKSGHQTMFSCPFSLQNTATSNTHHSRCVFSGVHSTTIFFDFCKKPARHEMPSVLRFASTWLMQTTSRKMLGSPQRPRCR